MDHEFEEFSYGKGEYVKFALVIISICVISFLLNGMFGSDSVDSLLRWFMGIFFVTFGTFKFIGYEMFTEMFPSYDILAAKSRIYTYAYPFIELLLGCFYLVNAFGVMRDVVTFVLMTVSAIGIYQTIKVHGNVQCACLGNVIKLPLSSVSLFENGLMAVMAAVMIVI